MGVPIFAIFITLFVENQPNTALGMQKRDKSSDCCCIRMTAIRTRDPLQRIGSWEQATLF